MGVRPPAAGTVKPPTWADLDQLRDRAQAAAAPATWAVIEDGADDELTLRENVAAWSRLQLLPRVLRDVSRVDTAAVVLGTAVAAPILVGPSGRHGLFHPEGEVATARGAAAAGTVLAVATAASRSLEDVAAAAPEGDRWFQLYVTRDRVWTEELIERAEAAGYRAIVLTVDVMRVGNRRGTQRLPVTDGPRWGNAQRRYGAAAVYGGPDFAGGFDDSLTFADIEWLRARTRLPIVVKGVLRADDAAACVEAGASAVVVSNHGGRQLDGAIATAYALPAVVEAVGGRGEVYVDGGIRRGTDVLRALALGARAVLVVRPVLHGLLMDGSAGVCAVVVHLQEQLRHAMTLAGVRSIAEIGPDLVAGGGHRSL
jgi:4-hydroxymandelate oxidase